MYLFQKLEDLQRFDRHTNQHWFFVILANANDPTDAAKRVLNNLDMFDLDTDCDCDYFLPGFLNGPHGPLSDWIVENEVEVRRAAVPEDAVRVHLSRLGRVPFSGVDFVKFYKKLEEQVNRRWRYSGGCELLVFNFNRRSGLVDFSDFCSYNLDDIVKNGRSISEFIRLMIMISQDRLSKVRAKRAMDEIYFDLVMLRAGDYNANYMSTCIKAFEESGFPSSEYCFISYCTKDFEFVKRVRDQLQEGGVKCWMAPFDIPRGTSYPYVIENAILSSSAFVLMLTRDAINSAWVEKELLRAISAYQLSAPERLCVVWCRGEFPLRGTAFALPLENVQIKVDLEGNPENWMRLGLLLTGDAKASDAGD